MAMEYGDKKDKKEIRDRNQPLEPKLDGPKPAVSGDTGSDKGGKGGGGPEKPGSLSDMNGPKIDRVREQQSNALEQAKQKESEKPKDAPRNNAAWGK